MLSQCRVSALEIRCCARFGARPLQDHIAYADVTGKTPLAFAVCLGVVEVVELMLHHGHPHGIANVLDRDRRVPAFWAVATQNPEMLTKCLEYATFFFFFFFFFSPPPFFFPSTFLISLKA